MHQSPVCPTSRVRWLHLFFRGKLCYRWVIGVCVVRGFLFTSSVRSSAELLWSARPTFRPVAIAAFVSMHVIAFNRRDWQCFLFCFFFLFVFGERFPVRDARFAPARPTSALVFVFIFIFLGSFSVLLRFVHFTR